MAPLAKALGARGPLQGRATPGRPLASTQATCPLCCEELDDTDRDFYPCVCRYQICLFCYEKVKEKCNSLCPGCRREYGEPLDAEQVKQAEERAMEAARASAAMGQQQQPRSAVATATPSGGGTQLQMPRLPSASSMGSTATNGHMQQLQQQQATPRGVPAPAAPAPKPDVSMQRRGLETAAAAAAPAAYSKRADTAAVAALPTGATWAAAGGQVPRQQQQHVDGSERPAATPPQQQQPQQQQAVDASAWPSLADSTAAAAAAIPAARPPRQTQDYHSQSFQSAETTSSNGSHHRSTSAASSASAEGMHSRSSSSQDLHQDVGGGAAGGPHQHRPGSGQGGGGGGCGALSSTASSSAASLVPPHLMDAFGSAQVSSMVHGVRHSIHVPLPVNAQPPVDAWPEASSLRTSMQQAVKAGTLDTKEAAARLVALLRQKEAELNGGGVNGVPRPPTLLAAGKAPPPGFGPPAVTHTHAPSPSPSLLPPFHPVHPGSSLLSPPTFTLNTQDPVVSIPRPPLGKFQPIQPPLLHPGGSLAAPGSVLFGGGSGAAAPGSGRLHPTLAVPSSSQGGVGIGMQQPQQQQEPQQQQQQLGGWGTYSLWSGLPGLELPTAGPPSWQHAPPGLQQQQQQFGLQQQQQPVGRHATVGGGFAPSGSAASVAPPGFGPAVGRAPARQPYQESIGGVVGAAAGGDNPLQAQLSGLSRPPPPGMTAYRPF